MAKGLFLGLTTLDILSYVSNHPGPNEKRKADWQAVFAGGPAANAAVAYAALGNDSQLCSAVGSHPLARFVHEDLFQHRVLLHDRSAEQDGLPVISSILINRSSGERCVVYSDTGARRLLADGAYSLLLDGCKTLLLDGFYLTEARRLAELARQRGVMVILDGGSWKQGLEHLLPFVDYALCSADFFPPGSRSFDESIEYLADHGIRSCAFSRGNMPVISWQDGKRELLGVPVLKAVDTLGAGDVLHGAFCHYIARMSFQGSLQRAILIASHSCRFPGTREWIAHLDQEEESQDKEG